MNLPSKLKIGGHKYRIIVAQTWGTFEPGDCGETDYNNGIIYINSDLQQTEQEAALLHEIFHVLNKTINHEFLDSLSEQLYQVLKDNKLLNE